MKAMILAAGVGSRLGKLTQDTPKALIEISGIPVLEIVIRKLISVGSSEIIVNVFHKPELIAAFLKMKGNFGIRIELSHEKELLDTGGGLKNAAWFFDDNRPFLVHNVDVYSDVDLEKLYRLHSGSGALVTLSARARESARYFLFNGQGQLCGWENAKAGRKEWANGPVPEASRLAFDGIHAVSPRLFSVMKQTGVFSITGAYLKLAAAGEKIEAFRSDEYYWQDIGKLAGLDEVRNRP